MSIFPFALCCWPALIRFRFGTRLPFDGDGRCEAGTSCPGLPGPEPIVARGTAFTVPRLPDFGPVDESRVQIVLLAAVASSLSPSPRFVSPSSCDRSDSEVMSGRLPRGSPPGLSNLGLCSHPDPIAPWDWRAGRLPQGSGRGGAIANDKPRGWNDRPVEHTPGPETVYITDTGKKYHDAGCRHLRSSSTAIRRVAFMASVVSHAV